MPIPSKKKGEDPKYTSLIEEADFLMSRYKSESDDKAGYPPNCNEGYVEKDGKCVPSEKSKEWRKKK